MKMLWSYLTICLLLQKASRADGLIHHAPFAVRENGAFVLVESKQIPGFSFQSKTVGLSMTKLISDYEIIQTAMTDLGVKISSYTAPAEPTKFVSRNPSYTTETLFARG